MTKQNTSATPNLDKAQKEFEAYVREQGALKALEDFPRWMYELQVAVIRDAGGLKVDDEVDVRTARLAALNLWRDSRYAAEASTSEGANQMARYRVKALRRVADDPRIEDLLRKEYQDNKENRESVY